jgi:diadenosine tetraphosphatase ApaH/serine/threonine PP2A family protein phosphatase
MKKHLTNLENLILPSENDIRDICNKVKEILSTEPNVLYLNPPIQLMSDNHGTYYDLLEAFFYSGKPPDKKYLFLGDYVDRGNTGVEVFIYLMLFKILYPNRIYLLRGNHETVSINMVYGFYDECLRKYNNPNVFYYIQDVFNLLPICAIVNDVFCVHGGLCPDLLFIDDLEIFDRNYEIPTIGAISDLLWSDPEEQYNDWEPSSRGAGYTFGEGAVDKFNEANNIYRIYRGHQLCMDGFRYQFNKKIVTVWSAPNYCGRSGNLASVCQLDDDMNESFIIFKESAFTAESDNDEPPSYFL